MLKFTTDHEWVQLDGDTATVGITTHAAGQLGDVVFVELPDTGKTVTKGGPAAVVESVKAASEVYAPLDGEIVAVNDTVTGDPSLVNSDPQGQGWFFKMRLANAADFDGLLDEDAYKKLTA